jgi:hypothetical protein
VEEVGNGIVVRFKSNVELAWPMALKKYLTHAGISSTGFGRVPRSTPVPVPPAGTRLAAVTGSPWAIDKTGPAALVQAEPVREEDGVVGRSPFSNEASESVVQPQMRPRAPVPSPWATSEEKPSEPSTILVDDDTKRPFKAPWSNG